MPSLRHLALAAGLLAAAPAALAAQTHATDRGSLILGGSAGFSSSGTTVDGEKQGDRSTSLNFSPSAQYFVLPGLAVGGDATVLRQSAGDNVTTVLGVGPAASYYFGGAERSVLPFVSGSLQYLRFDNDNTEVSRLGYRASTGAVFMLTRSVGLTGSLYYQAQLQDVDDADVNFNSYGLSFGFSAFTF